MIREKRYTILCLFLLSKLFFAQKTIIPERITIEDGLLQSSVSCVIQDKDGFLWVGSPAGLSRYDGRSFEHFQPNSNEEFALTIGAVMRIKDADDFMLISGLGGINLFQKSTKRFFEIPLDDFMETGFSPSIIEIEQDGNGDYWFSEIYTSSLFKLTFGDQFFEKIGSNEINLDDISIRKIETGEGFSPVHITAYKDQLIYVSKASSTSGRDFHMKSLDINTEKITDITSGAFPKNFSSYWFKPYKDKLLFSLWYSNNLYSYDGKQWKAIKTDFSISSFTPIEPLERMMFTTQFENASYIFNDKDIESGELLKKNAYNPSVQDIIDGNCSN